MVTEYDRMCFIFLPDPNKYYLPLSGASLAGLGCQDLLVPSPSLFFLFSPFSLPRESMCGEKKKIMALERLKETGYHQGPIFQKRTGEGGEVGTP